MGREFWNSMTTVVRSGSRALVVDVAVGRLDEMVEYLLSQPLELRGNLSLKTEVFEHPLGQVEVESLRRRTDFPLVC